MTEMKSKYPRFVTFLITVANLNFGFAKGISDKALTKKEQTKSGNIVTITLVDDSYSGSLHGRQKFQVFIDPALGYSLEVFKSASLIFLRKPKRSGYWQPLCGFDAIFREHQGTLTHILAHGVLKKRCMKIRLNFRVR